MLIVEQFALDTVESIALLHKQDKITQSLILLYSAIDTLAWLGVPSPSTSRSIFKQWVNQYLLPGSILSCTAVDLYSARCGLLHTTTAESDATVSGDARQIWYWTGENSRKLLEYQAAGRSDIVFVRVADLLAAFAEATQRFVVDLARDQGRKSTAQDKASRWLGWIPAPPAA